ncbi:hypothetical protein BKA67DRAFT_69285 [Truncatella angustata]|uniref:Uncharacterized protein n=1 Tax=Truncatella angustata TaxID=152316 RepID=A0A9P8UZU6_9PEZI|nr:uncharacterized protein BKA67DRAFT_69285 [Truncatella angustata]KAH6660884.1 hypothetical protein BKA67DRAFT_69285 [Truncatella angustata]KAH8199232.1 hypothetical protein TruAng_006572 [Truncatella angustata]
MMTEGGPSTLLEGFIRHVQALAQDDSYGYLKGILEENTALKDRNHILNITNDENARTISKLQQHLDESTKRGEERVDEINTLTQDKVLLEARVEMLEADSETIKAQLHDTEDEASKLRAELAEKTVDLENAQAQLEGHTERVSKVQTELDDRTAELENTNAQLNEKAEEVSRLQNEVTEKTTEIGSINTLLHDKTEESSRLQADLDERKIELENILTQLTEKTDDISRLQTDVENKTTELQDTHTELTSTTSQLEESRVESSKLHEDVETKDLEIVGLKTSLEEGQSAIAASKAEFEEATNELHSIREDLEAKNTRLGELNALSYKMKSPPQNQTHHQLHNMFTLAYSWVEKIFTEDLEESAFQTVASGTVWAKIRNHGRVNRIIPLPLSNTREAKQMRISAVLAILAWSLAQYIFQPTYLLQCNELSDLLAGLADGDPVRENYLRSVLLPVLPSRQKSNGKKRIEQVVTEVFTAVSPVLSSQKHDEFRSSLEAVCKQICGQWMRLQLLDEKIEPSFDAYDEEDWKLLNLSTFDGSGVDTRAEDAAPESAIADDERYQSVGDIEDIAAVLWPSFLSFRGGESELLTEGHVLSKAQVKPAYNEEKVALLQGIHRAARQISRKDRTKSFVTSGEDMSAEKNFLPMDPDEQPGGASIDKPPPEPNGSEDGLGGGAIN